MSGLYQMPCREQRERASHYIEEDEQYCHQEAKDLSRNRVSCGLVPVEAVHDPVQQIPLRPLFPPPPPNGLAAAVPPAAGPGATGALPKNCSP